MNKRIFSLVLAVVMLAALVSGCAPVPTQAPAGEAAGEAAGEPVTLEFTQWWDAGTARGLIQSADG